MTYKDEEVPDAIISEAPGLKISEMLQPARHSEHDSHPEHDPPDAWIARIESVVYASDPPRLVGRCFRVFLTGGRPEGEMACVGAAEHGLLYLHFACQEDPARRAAWVPLVQLTYLYELPEGCGCQDE